MKHGRYMRVCVCLSVNGMYVYVQSMFAHLFARSPASFSLTFSPVPFSCVWLIWTRARSHTHWRWQTTRKYTYFTCWNCQKAELFHAIMNGRMNMNQGFLRFSAVLHSRREVCCCHFSCCFFSSAVRVAGDDAISIGFAIWCGSQNTRPSHSVARTLICMAVE